MFAVRNGTFLVLIVLAVAALACVAVTVYGLREVCDDKVIKFYQDQLRSAMFGGFLTVAGFLFSLKTFIIVKMKEDVYDAPRYKKMINRRKKLNPNITQYGGLRNFAALLFWSVLLSFLAAISHFTIGLVPHLWAVQVAAWISIWTMFVFLASLIILQNNLRSWFEHLEEEQDSSPQ